MVLTIPICFCFQQTHVLCFDNKFNCLTYFPIRGLFFLFFLCFGYVFYHIITHFGWTRCTDRTIFSLMCYRGHIVTDSIKWYLMHCIKAFTWCCFIGELNDILVIEGAYHRPEFVVNNRLETGYLLGSTLWAHGLSNMVVHSIQAHAIFHLAHLPWPNLWFNWKL